MDVDKYKIRSWNPSLCQPKLKVNTLLGIWLNSIKTPNFTFLGVKLGVCFAICWFSAFIAERQGFEPWVPKRHNGFRDRPDRPLRHLSSVVFDSVQNYNFFSNTPNFSHYFYSFRAFSLFLHYINNYILFIISKYWKLVYNK